MLNRSSHSIVVVVMMEVAFPVLGLSDAPKMNSLRLIAVYVAVVAGWEDFVAAVGVSEQGLSVVAGKAGSVLKMLQKL